MANRLSPTGTFTETVPRHEWLRFRFHDLPGSAQAIYEGSTLNGAIALAGTTANLYADRGYIECAGDNTSFITDGRFDSLLEPNAAGGVLVLGRIKYTSGGGTTGQRIFQIGGVASSIPGYTIQMGIGANINLQMALNYAGGTTKLVQKVITGRGGQLIPFAFYINKLTDVLYLAIDGNWAGAASIATDGGAMSFPTSNWGMSLGGGMSVGPAAVSPSNGGASDYEYGDLVFVNDNDGAIFSNITSIVSEHAADTFMLPPTLGTI